MGQKLSDVTKFSIEKKSCRNSAAPKGQLLAQELAGIVEVLQNFLNVILKLLIHSIIPPDKSLSSQTADKKAVICNRISLPGSTIAFLEVKVL